MDIKQYEISIHTDAQGTVEITSDIDKLVGESNIKTGLAHIHCKHTSCSLVLMENADRSARSDLENWLNRLVPEDDPHFTHTYEGPDDMPSHIKMALTRSQETLPISNGHLNLGTWQGLFLWEHRNQKHQRSIVITLNGVG